MKSKSLIIITLIALLAAISWVPPASASGDKMPITTSSDKAREYFLKGRDLFERLRIPEARKVLEKAVTEDPEFALGYLQLAQSVTTTRDFSHYLELASKFKSNASDVEQWWIEAVQAGFVGDGATQLDRYQQIARAYPNDERARTLLGNIYFARQEWDNAIAEYEAAINAGPEFSQPYNQLGYAYRFLGQYDQAEKTFRKYIQVLPDDPNPYDSYAELLLKTGRFEESIQQYLKALKVDPTFVASYIGIVSDQTYLGKYDDARQTADLAFSKAVNDAQRRTACFLKCVTFVDQGEIPLAIQQLDRQMAIAAANNDAAAIAADLTAVGMLQLEMQKNDDALAGFLRSVEIVDQSGLSQDFKDNNRLNYLVNEGRVAVAKGELDKAIDLQTKFAAAAYKNSNNFQIWNAHELAGIIAMAQGKYDAALKEFQQSNLQNTYNVFRIARCYEEMGETQKAKEFYDKAANFNQLAAINYSLIRHRASQKLTSL